MPSTTSEMSSISILIPESPIEWGITILLSAVAFSAILLRNILKEIIVHEYKKRWSEGNKEWYKDAASLARQVQTTWEGQYLLPRERGDNYSFDKIKGEMGLLADQLDRHAADIESEEVEDEVYQLVRETAQECRSLEHVRTHIGKNKEFKQQGDKAEKVAERLEYKARAYI